MTDLKSYRQNYSRFLDLDPGKLHFAAHSHHPWPDCTRAAHLQYWDDSAKGMDHKWDAIFETVLGTAKTSIAELLNLEDATTLVTAPNTHEFMARLLSCLPVGKPVRLLTTDSEFHSADRQIRRFEEEENVTVDRVSVEPFETFSTRFKAKLLDPSLSYDFVFFSHVFFNSGFIVKDLESIVETVSVKTVKSSQTILAIDGYHAFCAIPIDLKKIQSRVFYLAGGYKYAQSGEGACFMHVPKNCILRPANTGWFAHYESLTENSLTQKEVTENSTALKMIRKTQYSEDGTRFAGATSDPTCWYRFNAVMNWWKRDAISVASTREHVKTLQRLFLDQTKEHALKEWTEEKLVVKIDDCGSFLTFSFPDAQKKVEKLKEKNVIVDARNDRLRVGFGIYQSQKDIDLLVKRLQFK